MAAGGASPQDVRWRVVPYDRDGLARGPEKRLLTALLDWAPRLPWRAHPSDSMAVWSFFVREAAATVAPQVQLGQVQALAVGPRAPQGPVALPLPV